MPQDEKASDRQRQALALLKLVAQGERDFQHGNVLSDAEAQCRFEALLRRLERGGREKFEAALAKLPDVEPEPYDKL